MTRSPLVTLRAPGSMWRPLKVKLIVTERSWMLRMAN
jgi:hypothetical protein